MDWPPKPGSETPAGGSAGKPRRHFPPAGWPTAEQIDYVRELIVLFLLILVLPYVLSKILTNPGAILGAQRSVLLKRVGP